MTDAVLTPTPNDCDLPRRRSDFATFNEAIDYAARSAKGLNFHDMRGTLERVYPRLKEIAIDNAVLELAEWVAVVEADIDWSDIGSWGALADVLPVDEHGNLVSADAITVDTTGSTVYAPDGKLVALIGVDNLVVVDSGDALLIVPKDEVQRVREIVDKLGDREDGGKYL